MLQALGANRIAAYHPLLEIQTHSLLKNILNSPDETISNIRRCVQRRLSAKSYMQTVFLPLHVSVVRYTGGLTHLIVYGYRVVSNKDRLLEMADEGLELLSNHIAAAGKVWIVDLFPPRTSPLSLPCRNPSGDTRGR